MLKNKDSEITNLKLELQKLKSHMENKIKKVTKAQNVPSNNNPNLTTSGSQEGNYPKH